MPDHLLPNASTTSLEGMTQRAKGARNVKQFVNKSLNMSVRHSSLHLTVVADKQVSQPANVTILTSTRLNSPNANVTGRCTFMFTFTVNKRQ